MNDHDFDDDLDALRAEMNLRPLKRPRWVPPPQPPTAIEPPPTRTVYDGGISSDERETFVWLVAAVAWVVIAALVLAWVLNR